MSPQSHAAQRLPRLPVPFSLRYAPDRQRQGHVLKSCILRQVVVALEHESDIAAAKLRPQLLVHGFQMVLTADDNLALGGRFQSRQHIQHGGLTGTTAARDADEFALQHGHIHAIQSTDRVAAHGIIFFQSHRLYDGFSFTHSSLSLI